MNNPLLIENAIAMITAIISLCAEIVILITVIHKHRNASTKPGDEKKINNTTNSNQMNINTGNNAQQVNIDNRSINAEESRGSAKVEVSDSTVRDIKIKINNSVSSKIGAIVLSVILLFVICFGIHRLFINNYTQIGIVHDTDGGLFINSAPNTENPIGEIPEGEKCAVYTHKTKGNWYYVKYDDIIGYSYNKYIELER